MQFLWNSADFENKSTHRKVNKLHVIKTMIQMRFIWSNWVLVCEELFLYSRNNPILELNLKHFVDIMLTFTLGLSLKGTCWSVSLCITYFQWQCKVHVNVLCSRRISDFSPVKFLVKVWQVSHTLVLFHNPVSLIIYQWSRPCNLRIFMSTLFTWNPILFCKHLRCKFYGA